MDRILADGAERGRWCVMLAYGAGLSAHAALVRMDEPRHFDFL